MTRLRTLCRRSPAVCVLAAMIALVAVAWGVPEIGRFAEPASHRA